MGVKVTTGGEVKIMVFNMAGEKVRVIQDSTLAPGNYRAFWDGKNSSGATVGNAVYILLIHSPDGETMKKVIVLK